MSYDIHQTDALVLAVYPRGEADIRMRVYTEKYGMLSIYAKGIRLEKSKLRGHVELFTHVALSFIAGREQYRLVSAETRTPFGSIRNTMSRFRAATAVARIAMHLMVDEEQDARIWQLIKEAFRVINSDKYETREGSLLLYAFQVKMVALLGYMPDDRTEAVDRLYNAPTLISSDVLTRQEEITTRLFLRDIYAYAGVWRPEDYA
ncbi:MAG: DNA repair protein RecO [Candidatus Ryanbacteria bacterium CG10_big_fil_rev_8_21_14_0_10_43_42]|uniref:DNA repair protein RecO n=1 Tax=Candidatus Ryanbacteria bacterium CG10_big_fil_rev_8_21_14_0_10_43_42 TaxID=1974864 RepID=A0A2M8KY02_9BACT|nr:MAG: DNA repair protein RecO [Candidatus Ryanbacteria bacterium CG10_big_fil_rev_8_21_14_0_10_43_42]